MTRYGVSLAAVNALETISSINGQMSVSPVGVYQFAKYNVLIYLDPSVLLCAAGGRLK